MFPTGSACFSLPREGHEDYMNMHSLWKVPRCSGSICLLTFNLIYQRSGIVKGLQVSYSVIISNLLYCRTAFLILFTKNKAGQPVLRFPIPFVLLYVCSSTLNLTEAWKKLQVFLCTHALRPAPPRSRVLANCKGRLPGL